MDFSHVLFLKKVYLLLLSRMTNAASLAAAWTP
jgi:hypothetical protein